MLSSLLITLREGLEAALIIGIVLAYLNRTNNRQGFKPVWIGTGLAILVSLLAGIVIYFTAGTLNEQAEQIFEGIVLLIACIVLTWMIFWMRKQSINIKGELQAQIDKALGSGSAFSLILLAFVAVVREGIETVLFLFGAITITESILLFLIGGIVGLGLAVGIGYSIYKGTSRLNLRTFFTVTGLLLVLFAAGLLAHGVHELEEAGIIPIIIEHLWDINPLLPEESLLGLFLTSIFGYNANPSLIEVVAYFTYLISILIIYFKPALVKRNK